MPPVRTADRLRRILVLVPWVMANPGVSVDEVCARFSMSRAELSADLDLLFLCGLPPFGPGDLMEAYIDEDEVVIRMADYLARPPRLTRAEALGLLVMGRALLSLPEIEQAASLRSALDKLAGALSPADAERAKEAANRIAVELPTPGADLLADVRRAIAERRRVRISYFSHGRGEMSTRAIDPLLTFHAQGNWYVAAFDHASGEERLFRVDRIRELEPTGETFEHPEGIDPARYAEGALFTPSSRDLDVAIDVAPAAAWVREFVQGDTEEPLADGWTRVHLRTPHLAWLVRVMLCAGPNARAVEPAELVDAVRDGARRALARYETS